MVVKVEILVVNKVVLPIAVAENVVPKAAVHFVTNEQSNSERHSNREKVMGEKSLSLSPGRYCSEEAIALQTSFLRLIQGGS